MSNIKYMNKENTQPFMTTSCQIIFSTKFSPCEINDMLFNDDTLKETLKSKRMLCRIGEYDDIRCGRYSYERFITKFSRPYVMIDDIVEMDYAYMANITVPDKYLPYFNKIKQPVIHPVVLGDLKTRSGFKIAYFVLYDKSQLISTNIYSGKSCDYRKDDKNENES